MQEQQNKLGWHICVYAERNEILWDLRLGGSFEVLVHVSL